MNRITFALQCQKKYVFKSPRAIVFLIDLFSVAFISSIYDLPHTYIYINNEKFPFHLIASANNICEV